MRHVKTFEEQKAQKQLHCVHISHYYHFKVQHLAANAWRWLGILWGISKDVSNRNTNSNESNGHGNKDSNQEAKETKDLKQEQDKEEAKHSTEILGDLLSADGHSIHDSNSIFSEFQPGRSPVWEGNEEVDSRHNEQEQSNDDEEIVKNLDEEEREEVIVAVKELICIEVNSTRTKSINSGQVDTVRNWEGQQSSNVWNEWNSLRKKLEM